MFDALVDEVTRRIEATEGRERSRRQTDQQCFEHSVKVTLADLWKSVRSIPLAECGHTFSIATSFFILKISAE